VKSSMVLVLVALLPSIAVAQNAASPPMPAHPPALHPQEPSVKAREDFRRKMASVPLPGKGCYLAHYPTAKWSAVQCGPAPKTPFPVARGARPNNVGGGTDYFATLNGSLVSSATGSFDAVTRASVQSNSYSLQLNANTYQLTANTPPGCTASSPCNAWEQFIFSQGQCSPACIFIEYWLLDHTKPCPTGADWQFYSGSKSTTPGCYLNSAEASVPQPSSADLGKLELSGAVANGMDTVSMVLANGDVVAKSDDSLLSLAQGWNGAEYNLVGDGNASEAHFKDNAASLVVRLNLNYGSTAAPTCATAFDGDTAETNNLNLIAPCTSVSGAAPAIVFQEGDGPAQQQLLFYEPSGGFGQNWGTEPPPGIYLQSNYTGWRTDWGQIVAGIFSHKSSQTPQDILFYEPSSGTGEFWQVDQYGHFTRLATNTDWRKTWSIIVPGKFSDGPFTDLLFYEASSGTGEFWRTDGHGHVSLIHQNTGWRKDWSIIVPGNFSGGKTTDLLFYERSSGTGEFWRTDADGYVSLIKSNTGWRTSWAQIVPGNFTGGQFTDLLLYDPSTSTGQFWKTDGHGNVTLVGSNTDWRNDWSLIVPGDFFGNRLTDLLFYERSTGTGQFWRTNGRGAVSMLLNFNDWRTDWSLVVKH
jgi:hypothetical protein